MAFYHFLQNGNIWQLSLGDFGLQLIVEFCMKLRFLLGLSILRLLTIKEISASKIHMIEKN